MEKRPHSGWRSLHFPVTTPHLRGGNTAEISEAKIYTIFHCLKVCFLAVHSPKTYIYVTKGKQLMHSEF